ncbi:MAG: MipA/OmpV family protein [Caulobacterales bacterium]
MRINVHAAAVGLALAAAAPAFAQVTAPESNIDTLPRFSASGDWRVTVGAAALVGPTFEGADTLRALAVPDIDVRWRNRAFASVRTGVGVNLVTDGGWRVGPYAKLNFGRDEGRSAKLKGLGDVDPTIEVGGFAEKSWRFARASLEVRQGLGGHEGAVAEVGGDLRFRLSERLAAAAGPRVRFADATYLQAFYGVDAAQSARSGLARFAPESGLESAGLAGALVLRPQPRTTLTLFAEQSRLFGDAAESPLVRLRGARDQTRLGVAVGYRLGGAVN